MNHSEIPWAKIAVFDLNHGGFAIAEQLSKKGIYVTVFDVYGKTSEEQLKSASERYGFSVSGKVEDLENPDGAPFEIICSPIHLYGQNEFFKKADELKIPIITHHDMVGRLLHGDKRLAGKKLFEITGVRGKTSTAILFAQMISAKKTVSLHTSKGLSIWKDGNFTNICDGISISPAYVPSILDLIFDAGYDPDFFIFEISLGSTGAEDVGILTTLDPEYMVSGNTVSSTDIKTQIFTRAKENGTFIVNYDDWAKIKSYIRQDQKVIIFDASGKAISDGATTDAFLDISKGKDGASTLEIESSRNSLFFSTLLKDGYDAESYKIAFAASISAALEFDVSESYIADIIRQFKGINGRMQESQKEDRFILDNSNSGLDIYSCEFAIKYMLGKYFDKKSAHYDPKRKLIVVIGEENKTVCSGMLPQDIDKLLNVYKKEISESVFVGSRLHDYMQEICAVTENQDGERKTAPTDLDESGDVCALYADDFVSGFEKALEVSKEGDVIVLNVKCFR
ncbi:coenzyme F430 synthase [Methanolapillus ohkumae]|uniref:UDP-N-acetylmuramoylalanine--D-glutamate ligase n=1 Tax=Methanolapillus ohkumae TaxID=3028298 RepID=A0AA96V5Y7_9EURY|nr:UDP-N-acetylmuramoylalanine--D-glutamate ligase [Methanosarcinaceae archaeon Am2]